MEADDIEDGEILEDESNSNDQILLEKSINEHEFKINPYEVDNFESFFHPNVDEIENKIDKFPDYHKNSRWGRLKYPSNILKKHKRHRENEKSCYDKKNKHNYKRLDLKYEDHDVDNQVILVLGDTLKDTEKKKKLSKKAGISDASDNVLNSLIFQGENDDPRPYSKRTSLSHDAALKKDRGSGSLPMGGNVHKRNSQVSHSSTFCKNKIREELNEACLPGYYMSGKSQRKNECSPYPHSFSGQLRKPEVCKFYLQDCCTKRDKCMYMHSEFPCIHYHTPNSTCSAGKNCKFSHGKLDDLQHIALKKCSESTIAEMDDIQRLFRERENTISCKEKKKQSRIPSLFDIKVSIPPEFQNADKILDQNYDYEKEGTGTPMPSPPHDSLELINDKMPLNFNFSNYNNVFSKQNDFWNDVTDNSTEQITKKRKNKKKDKKSSDNELDKTSGKHSEKSKKRSRKDGKSSKGRKKRRENSYCETENVAVEEAVAAQNDHHLDLDTFACSMNSPKSIHPDLDALSHLPKKQQELFLRIQQHQKEVNTSQQNLNVNKKGEEDELKQDENWYSSDEEEEKVTETTSALATILRTIQSNKLPMEEKKVENKYDSATVDSEQSPFQSQDTVSVDASHLANIDLSDEVTQLLTSICMKTDSNNQQISNNELAPKISKENQGSLTNKKFPEETNDKFNKVTHCTKESAEDSDFRLLNLPLFSANTNYNDTKDIDLRALPFKPIPIHDAANEIDASITSHPPMEYKLIPLPFISRVNYAAMTDTAKICPNDPRFKKSNDSSYRHGNAASVMLNPNSSHYSQIRIADPRLADLYKSDCRDPRLIDAKTTSPVSNVITPLKCDQRINCISTPDIRLDAKEQFRDPRLTSRNKITEAYVVTPTKEISLMNRKEDPRLRFRSKQNQ